MTPLALHPGNNRYLLFRGKPTVLITSAEHYGAVLNGDFDFRPYLRELGRRGLNQSRAFSGAYREVPGNFGIAGNTLAPRPEHFVAPWPRTTTPGAADGLGKFDLSRWNDVYFRRLGDYLREAGKHGVVIEVALFCPFYEDTMWNVSPMNGKNNVNGVGQDVPRTDVYTLKHADLTRVQDALTRKLVEAVAPFDNVYLEICNEPYFGGVTLDWQRHIADTITDAQRARSAKHLIAQNIANGSAKVENPHPAVSIFNFHYASPPDAVRANLGLNKPIAFDETGFAGTDDATYRRQAWEFLLTGGSVFSHLDYSFTADGHESGTFAYPKTQPGGGGAALRTQLGHLKRFFDSLPFIRMRPDDNVLASSAGLPSGVSARALSEPGKQYAIYLNGNGATRLSLALPAGRYEAHWWDTRAGRMEEKQRAALTHRSTDPLVLDVPPYTEDVALRLVRDSSR